MLGVGFLLRGREEDDLDIVSVAIHLQGSFERGKIWVGVAEQLLEIGDNGRNQLGSGLVAQAILQLVVGIVEVESRELGTLSLWWRPQ